MAARTEPEIEHDGSDVIFHHLRAAGRPRRIKVPTESSLFAQPNAPGSLRRVSGHEAWELGALAAIEDERLFGTES